jgi:hypothetical protein
MGTMTRQQAAMSQQIKSGWRWLALPLVVAVAAGLVVVLGTAAYLLIFEWACPSQARLDSSCYSDGFLLLERGSFLLIAAVTAFASTWSGYWVAPRARFLTAQWLAFGEFVLASLILLALDWDMWPLYGAFIGGLLAALLLLRIRQVR